MSSTLEPAIWSCDTGQRTPCLTAVNQEMIPQYYFNESVNVKIKEIAMPRTPRMPRMPRTPRMVPRTPRCLAC